MAYDRRQIANCFIRLAADNKRVLFVTTMLKLVDISHGWALALLGRPLIEDRIEAWQYGPVIPKIYYNFKNGQGPFNINEKPMGNDESSLIDQVYDIYGDMSARKLSKLTHIPGGPWDIVTKARGHVIPDELIKSYYMEKKRESEQHG